MNSRIFRGMTFSSISESDAGHHKRVVEKKHSNK